MNVGCKLGFDRLFTVDYLIYGIHGSVLISVLIMSSVIVFFLKTLL